MRVRVLGDECWSAYQLTKEDVRWCVLLFAAFVAVYSLLLPYVLTNWPRTADEPHYLAIAESMVADRDLDLRNNSALCAIDPHVIIMEDGRWRPAHMIGLPLLLAVPYLVGGHTAASFFLIVVAAAVVMWTYLLALEITHQRGISLASAVLLGSTPPFLVYAFTIYPEVPGSLALTIALWGLYRGGEKARYLVVASLMASLLPWLVVRFAPLSLLIGLCALLVLIRERYDIRRFAAAFVPAVSSFVLYLSYHSHLYDSLSPLAAYTISNPLELFVSTKGLVASLLGWILDQRSGAFFFFPIFVFSIPGLYYIYRKSRISGVFLFSIIGLHIFFNLMLPGFWVQWGPPTRYLVALAPILCISVSFAFCHCRTAIVRAIMLASLLASLLNSGLFFLRPWLYFNRSFSESQSLSYLSNITSLELTAWLPLAESNRSFKDKRHPVREDLLLYFPGVETLSVERADLIRDELASYGYATFFPKGEPPGVRTVSLTIDEQAVPGTYHVRVRLRAAPDSQLPSDHVVFRLYAKAVSATQQSVEIRVLEVPASMLASTYQWFEGRFENDSVQRVDLVATVSNEASVWLDSLAITHVPSPARGWRLMALWLGLCVAICALACIPTGSGMRVQTIPVFGVAMSACSFIFLLGMALWFNRISGPGHWRFDAEGMRRQVGSTRLDITARQWLAAATDQAGVLAYGPYLCFQPGSYEARFRLRMRGEVPPTSELVTVDVTAHGGNLVLVSSTLGTDDLDVGEYRDVIARFELEQELALEFRVHALGLGEVWLDDIHVSRVDR